MPMRHVVVTGMGVVCPLGNSPDEAFTSALSGRSGIGRLETEYAAPLDTRVGGQCDFDAATRLGKQRANNLDRSGQFALDVARQAITDAGLGAEQLNHPDTGIFLGTGLGGAASLDEGYQRVYLERLSRIKPFTLLMAMNNGAAGQLAYEYGIIGSNLTYSTACASSAVSIGEAFRRIRDGYSDVMLAGGTDAPLNFGTIKAWEAMRALAPEDPDNPSASCKPFAADRNGLVLAEGAALLVLEEASAAKARGAHIYAELTGYGTGNDAAHMVQPSVEGQARAMLRALECAGLKPEDIGYINAHGTGTPLNDSTETAAIKSAFGSAAERLTVSSTKSAHGHLMGATAALEMVMAIVALNRQIVPPTINLQNPDPACDLDYVPQSPRELPELRHVMSNSFAFGGTSGVLIASRYDG